LGGVGSRTGQAPPARLQSDAPRQQANRAGSGAEASIIPAAKAAADWIGRKSAASGTAPGRNARPEPSRRRAPRCRPPAARTNASRFQGLCGLRQSETLVPGRVVEDSERDPEPPASPAHGMQRPRAHHPVRPNRVRAVFEGPGRSSLGRNMDVLQGRSSSTGCVRPTPSGLGRSARDDRHLNGLCACHTPAQCWGHCPQPPRCSRTKRRSQARRRTDCPVEEGRDIRQEVA
jgi:hypothetical protein